MTIQEVIGKLQAEKQNRLPGTVSLPCYYGAHNRAVFRLLEELKNLGDISMVPIDTLFSGADVMPNYESLTGKEYQDKWLILPGVSEYLRLFTPAKKQRNGLVRCGIFNPMPARLAAF